MSDNVAILDGYTEEIHAYGRIYSPSESKREGKLFLLVRPDTDFTKIFKAWDIDNQEYVFISHYQFRLIVKTWNAVNAITPRDGLRIVVVGTGTETNPEGDFTWCKTWNPFTRQYSILRT